MKHNLVPLLGQVKLGCTCTTVHIGNQNLFRLVVKITSPPQNEHDHPASYRSRITHHSSAVLDLPASKIDSEDEDAFTYRSFNSNKKKSPPLRAFELYTSRTMWRETQRTREVTYAGKGPRTVKRQGLRKFTRQVSWILTAHGKHNRFKYDT
jgi:hypothetical protein